MDTTITLASTCSRVVTRPPSKPACEAFRPSRSGASTARAPTPTGSRSLPRLDRRHIALAPRIQRVVERSLESNLQAVVFAVNDRESMSDRLQSSRLGRQVHVRADVGSVHGLGQAVKRGA